MARGYHDREYELSEVEVGHRAALGRDELQYHLRMGNRVNEPYWILGARAGCTRGLAQTRSRTAKQSTEAGRSSSGFCVSWRQVWRRCDPRGEAIRVLRRPDLHPGWWLKDHVHSWKVSSRGSETGGGSP
jgi:hypothetical protein